MSGSFSLRVIAVGQASPRWKGAHNNAEADRNNERLARTRADNTRSQVEAILRKKLPGVPVQPGVSRVVGLQGDGVELGAYGVGSRESLVRVHGDRTSNEAIDRTVKISIEVTTTEQGKQVVSTPGHEIPTKVWQVTVTRYYVDAAAVAVGYMRIRLRKWATGETMDGEAFLYGGGLSTDFLTNPEGALTSMVKNRLITAAKDAVGKQDSIGRPDVTFSTNRNMTFRDFNGTFVGVERASAQLFIGAEVLYVTFRGLGSDAELIPIQHGLVTGAARQAEAYVVVGKLHMIGPYPGDGSSAVVPVETESSAGDDLVITFPTEEATVPIQERPKIEQFVSNWTKGLSGP